jgi:hypothetical protein
LAELKTQRTGASVPAFLAGVADEARARDCRELLRLMRRVTGLKAEMWGDAMVGFGIYRYTYPTGHSGQWFEVGFSPRKRDLTLYLMAGFDGLDTLLARLGHHRRGKSCLHITRLSDIDLDVLEQLVAASLRRLRRRHS